MLKKGMLLIFCTMVLGLSVCAASPENMPEPSEDAEVVPIENTKRYPDYYDDMVEEYIDKVNDEFEAIGDHGFASVSSRTSTGSIIRAIRPTSSGIFMRLLP